MLIAFFILLDLLLLAFYLSRQPSSTSKPVLTVGGETIYTTDLAAQSLRYPPMPGQEAAREEILRALLIRDSIILQGAARDGLTTLDKTIFNSPAKDLTKRKETIQAIEYSVTQQASRIQGEIVSVWFMNITPGAMGYEAGKSFAYATMLPLYTQVQRGEITLQEAGQRIQNNAALAQVDAAYQTNAYYAFDLPLETTIVFDPDFDHALKSLAPGELSELQLIQDYEHGDPTQPKRDAVYMFGKVSERHTSSIDSFASWYESHKNHYSVSNR